MKTKLIMGLIAFILLYIFKNWFFLTPLSAGDWNFRFDESLVNFPYFPYAWDPHFNSELGNNAIFLLPLNSYYIASARFFSEFLGIKWILYERLVWFFPYFISSIVFSYLFSRKFFGLEKIYSILSSFIYTFNSYSLLISSGGQMGIGITYSLFPLAALIFMSLKEEIDSLRKIWSPYIVGKSIIAGLILSILLMFDLRITYIFLFFISAYFLYLLVFKRKNTLLTLLYLFVGPGSLTFLLHSFWLIPFFTVKQNPLQELGTSYTSLDAVKFFSFTTFEKAFSLLHPNWPENFFGKTTFMRADFLLIPVIGFLTLLFIKTARHNYKIIFIMIAILVSSFLAKGANDPYGDTYLFLFEKLPGFQMFRDSSKWYVILALSYSILLPFSLSKILSEFNKKSKFRIDHVVIFGFILLWCFLLRDVFISEPRGTYSKSNIPNDYINLKNILSSDESFSRTLWLPSISSYAYYDMNHPRVAFSSFFGVSSPSAVFDLLNKKEAPRTLRESSIKYLIVPLDSQASIFVNDRKYDDDLFQEFSTRSASLPYLGEVSGFSKMRVFEIKDYKNHFWSDKDGLVSQINYINPTRYEIEVSEGKKGDKIIFAENYDKHWYAKKLGKIGSEFINSSAYNNLNSFTLHEDGSYTIEIFYYPQKFVNFGFIVGVVTAMALGGVLLIIKIKNIKL